MGDLSEHMRLSERLHRGDLVSLFADWTCVDHCYMEWFRLLDTRDVCHGDMRTVLVLAPNCKEGVRTSDGPM